MTGHQGPVMAFSLSSSSTGFLISASKDGTCRLWQVGQGAKCREVGMLDGQATNGNKTLTKLECRGCW